MSTQFDYYLQRGPKSDSLRRYPSGEEKGQRWDDKLGWINDCAPRSACVLTKDSMITEARAKMLGAKIDSADQRQ